MRPINFSSRIDRLTAAHCTRRLKVRGRAVPRPLSFYDSDRYWGDYVCALPGMTCSVLDSYDPHDYSVRPLAENRRPPCKQNVSMFITGQTSMMRRCGKSP